MANFSDILLSTPQQITRQVLSQEPDVCNISDQTLLDLCGGMPIDDPHNFRMVIKVTGSCIYEVAVFCEEYYLNRTIDFNDQEIINNHMRVRNPGNGLGTTLFINQVNFAVGNNFNRINVVAVGPGNGQTGHRKWGRVGFEMSDLDAADFAAWCRQFGFQQVNLFELLRMDDGYEFWTDLGFNWYGTFDLTAGSECHQRLTTYVQDLADEGITPGDV